MFITSSTTFKLKFKLREAGVASQPDMHLSGNVSTCQVNMDMLGFFYFLSYFSYIFPTISSHMTLQQVGIVIKSVYHCWVCEVNAEWHNQSDAQV